MIRQLRLMAFHVRQFAAVAYFARLMVFTTIATTIVQWLAVTAWGDSSPEQGWVRGGIIGMWTTATCAAGIIGFERFKGTLVYLIAAPIGALRALVAPVVAASSFGLLAFPVSWLTWVICSHSVPGLPADTTVITFVLAVLMLYLGCVALTITIAALFVLTPNAISYEGLLVVPIFLLSGVLFFVDSPPSWIAAVSTFLPLATPVYLLAGKGISIVTLLIWCAVTCGWFVLGWITARLCLRRALVTNTLEVV